MESTIEVLRARLAAYKGRWPEVAKESRLSVHTLRKVAQGQIENPGVGTVDKINRGLESLDGKAA